MPSLYKVKFKLDLILFTHAKIIDIFIFKEISNIKRDKKKIINIIILDTLYLYFIDVLNIMYKV